VVGPTQEAGAQGVETVPWQHRTRDCTAQGRRKAPKIESQPGPGVL